MGFLTSVMSSHCQRKIFARYNNFWGPGGEQWRKKKKKTKPTDKLSQITN